MNLSPKPADKYLINGVGSALTLDDAMPLPSRASLKRDFIETEWPLQRQTRGQGYDSINAPLLRLNQPKPGLGIREPSESID